MGSFISGRLAATCTEGDREGGSREEGSSAAGRCMVKTTAGGPGTVEEAVLGIVAEREGRTTTATTRESIHVITSGAWATGNIKTSALTTICIWSSWPQKAQRRGWRSKADQLEVTSSPWGQLWCFHLLRQQVVNLTFIQSGCAEEF